MPQLLQKGKLGYKRPDGDKATVEAPSFLKKTKTSAHVENSVAGECGKDQRLLYFSFTPWDLSLVTYT
ncbi:MAG TPA: hypothetical protein VF598_07180 [Hymenobacter sp.]